jgi:hypothetical protein
MPVAEPAPHGGAASRDADLFVANAAAGLLERRSIIGSHPQANGASAPTRLNIGTVELNRRGPVDGPNAPRLTAEVLLALSSRPV